MKRIASLALILALALSLAAPVSAADKTTGTKMSLEEFDGTVTVRDAAGKDKTARADMRLYNGYTIATGKASSAYINLDDTAAVKLDRGTKVEIRTLGKQLDVHLLSGQLFFDTKVPRKADQSYTISTSTTVTGVRGSFGWVNLKQMGMVHGHSTVTYVDEETGKTVTIPITSGEGLSRNEDGGAAVSGNAGAFEKTVLTVADIPAIVAEAIAADPQKQAQVDEVANLDTQEIVDSVDEKKEAEAQAEEKAEKAAEEAAGQQQEEIKQLDDADKKAGEETKVKLDADKKAEEDAKAREEAREERIREREEITEPPVQPSEPSQPSTPAQKSKTFTSAPEQADLEDALHDNDIVTIPGGGSYTSLTIPSGKTLTLAATAVSPDSPTATTAETIFKVLTNEGAFVVQNGATARISLVDTNGNALGVESVNRGTITNNGKFYIGDTGNAAYQSGLSSLQNYGTFTNNNQLTTIASVGLLNKIGSKFTSSGTIAEGSSVELTVVFNANGGMIGDSEKTEVYIPYGTSDYAFDVPECGDYYRFLGWFTSASGGTKVADIEGRLLLTVTVCQTLYAHWESTGGNTGASGYIFVTSYSTNTDVKTVTGISTVEDISAPATYVLSDSVIPTSTDTWFACTYDDAQARKLSILNSATGFQTLTNGFDSSVETITTAFFDSDMGGDSSTVYYIWDTGANSCTTSTAEALSITTNASHSYSYYGLRTSDGVLCYVVIKIGPATNP